MKFDPIPVSQLEQEEAARKAQWAPWPNGTYDFEIISSTDGTSKSSGAPMITVELRVFSADGKHRDLKDYLVGSLQGKIHALCKSIGIEDRYLAGELEAQDLLGCAGKCRLGIETDEWNGERRQKNKITGYIPPTASPVVSAAPQPAPKSGTLATVGRARGKAAATATADLDDEIPF